MNNLAGVVDVRIDLYPDTPFETLAETHTHLSCDANTVLTIISEVTWNPRKAQEVIEPGDVKLRDRQIRDENDSPGVLRRYMLSLLTSGLRLAVAERVYDQVRAIVAQYAGPKESSRFKTLLASRMLQVFIDEPSPDPRRSNDPRCSGPNDPADGRAKVEEEVQKAEGTSKKGRLKDLPRYVEGRFHDEGLTYIDPSVLSQPARTQRLLALYPLDIADRYDGRRSARDRLDWSLFLHTDSEEEDDHMLGDVELIDSERIRSVNREALPLLRAIEPGDARLPAAVEKRWEPEAKRARRDVVVAPCDRSLIERDGSWVSRRDDKAAKRRDRRVADLQRLVDEPFEPKCTRRITPKHVHWMSVSFAHSLPLITGDSALIRALKQQRIHLDNIKVAFTHPPRSLVGL
ncbi:hypothetical protein GNI_007830 [Gregarina niphandrodes]|uniref:Uncharacterized protein n=1 Tax=Gregarina niphandrodes TaxID=110365 RepID=A0A023BD73_GRENI|nr:hypothetical protein GNI_007830 [Gregarina niphandrodes]EZG87168.1 hypothetical protein GNI_007830 [Gregarina niphandrodes]|eukprot:XP_011128687.1 hypothetical protein GNI_007830 [Gregarina niphandrodes]